MKVEILTLDKEIIVNSLNARIAKVFDNKILVTCDRTKISDLDEDGFTEFFNKFMGVELGGLTIGIVGFGQIGQRVAKRLHNGFGSKILYFDLFIAMTLRGDI